MQYYRCRCGDSESWGSMAPYPCDKCNKCGSNLAISPSAHEDPRPHEFIVSMVETDEGDKPLSRCRWCSRTKSEIAKLEEKRNDQTSNQR